MYENMDRLFALRIPLTNCDHGNVVLAVTAYDANHEDPRTGHRRIDVRAVLHETVNGKRTSRVVFKRGDTWCAVPAGTTVDGDDAKELVCSLLGMKPGDTDSEYFENYTPEQLAFAEQYGETVDCYAMDRFGER